MRKLESENPDVFDFVLYDLGDHRVARCRATGLVIDSSAKVAFTAPTDQPWHRNSTESWTWLDDGRVTKMEYGKVRAAFTCWIYLIDSQSHTYEPISVERAIALSCFRVAKHVDILTFFR
jgi:hypothetical protein